MKIYIVRHGQTVSNILKSHGGSDLKLTPLGVRQAKRIASRVARLPINLIISSDYSRALETVAIIRKHLPRKRIITPLLREEKDPTEILGESINGPKARRVKKLRYQNRNRRQWHYSDEENFFDLKKRLGQFIKFLEKRKEKNILIIGHVVATRMLIALMTLGEALTPDAFYKIREHWTLNNGGISVCELIDGKWKLLIWNDYSHLG